MKSNKQNLYEQVRDKHPKFVYEGFSCALDDSSLCIVFEFLLENGPAFRPRLEIPVPENTGQDILADSLIRNIIFNMGMVELISYWKAACSPQLIIKASGLDGEQKIWWKKLYLHGLGEFFYENEITPANDFMEIQADGPVLKPRNTDLHSDTVLVPLGGGKDSVVSLELLRDAYSCIPMIINPREASLQSAYMAGFDDSEILKIDRTIDPGLLALNDKGYLNGHTPFSAMLAFTSLLVAALNGAGEIALSNESSANEPSVPGTGINHQYSKSLEFEKDFRWYVEKYISGSIQYYSFLRPLNELQISGLFSGFHKHHDTFKSCNVGSKTNSWCGECPKCLFTYIMLSVFLKRDELISIFGSDLYAKENLATTFDQLCGLTDEKPFECVGTIDEVNLAIGKLIDEYGDDELPFLLKRYRMNPGSENYDPAKYHSLLDAFDDHCIPDAGKVQLLKHNISAR
jgi:hypothetical protein